MIRWNSLFCYFDEALDLKNRLQKFLSDSVYEVYDAFALMPGKAYAQTAKFFIAPNKNGWTRILVDASDTNLVQELAQTLSEYGLCLFIDLSNDSLLIKTYHMGQSLAPEQALVPYLRGSKSATDIQNALAGHIQLMPSADEPSSQMPMLDDLPEDMKHMAQSINPAHAEKMFDKLSRQLVGKQSEEAGQLLNVEKLDWNSAGGQQIRALMACLSLDPDWRDPDFETLRAAYQRHARRQRKPDARLYSGDESAMAAVPDALDYTPVYGGK